MLRLTMIYLSLILTACGSGKTSTDPHRNPGSSSSLNSSSSLQSSSDVGVSSTSSASSLSSIDHTETSSSSSAGSSQNSHPTLGEAAFVPASVEDLDAWLRNGLRLSTDIGFTGIWRYYSEGIPYFQWKQGPRHVKPSFINIAVPGVDDGNHVKYDGEHLFYATSPIQARKYTHQTLHIAKADAQNAQLHPLSEIPLNTDDWTVTKDLYLVTNDQGETHSLATIRRPAFDMDLHDMNVRQLYNMGQANVDVDIYDITNPGEPDHVWRLSLEGDLMGSRKIGSMLYLVTSHVPQLPEIKIRPTTQEQQESNRSFINTVDFNRLLPNYQIADDSPRMLVDPAGCLLPQHYEDGEGHQQLITLVAIDLVAHELMHTVCLGAPVNGFFVSQSAIYLGGSAIGEFADQEIHTLIHKFNLTGTGFEYQASGRVKGQMNWRNPAFRMDEYEGDLRLVTTSQPDNVHRLSVLRPDPTTKSLHLVAQLPNDQRPQTIGKLDSTISAVRFDTTRAYVMTTREPDPLYVLDLSNLEDIRIAGELRIPGFSNYLHPVGENYLFSLGEANTRSNTVKLSLFDVSDIGQPRETSKKVYYARSPALVDQYALSFLQTAGNELRIALPISGNNSPSGLYQFELRDLDSAQAGIHEVGMIRGQVFGSLGLGAVSIMQENSVFYLSDSEINAYRWPE